MIKPLHFAAVSIISLSLMACVSSNPMTQSPIEHTEAHAIDPPVTPVTPMLATTGLTMEKIMSHPDWIGNAPETPFWSPDGAHVNYRQKRQGSVVRDNWQIDLVTGELAQVKDAEAHLTLNRGRVTDPVSGNSAWIFNNNVFLFNATSKTVSQLTRDNMSRVNLGFMADGRLHYQYGDAIYVLNPSTGLTLLLASWTFDDAPKAISAPDDYIAEQQLALISTLQKRRQHSIDRFKQRESIIANNTSTGPKPFYLPKKYRTVEASVSPAGNYLVLAIEKVGPSRDDSDIMPNYVVDSGRIEAQPVRRRVADSKPEGQDLYLLDLTSGTKKKLSFSVLPGYNEDVLAAVKRENAEANGKTYTTNRLPRQIGLLVDWGWSQSALSWHHNGNNVAVMLEAWDNKDRWLATIDLKTQQLVTQHRLHDDAWINYNFNSFGWLGNETTLYYLSEESGYSHLFIKPVNGVAKQLTQGQYEVDELTLSADDAYMYYQANQKHPGIYEIYRVSLQNGDIEQLTHLNGMTDYVLSDDGTQLLLSHSTLTTPPELFVQAAELDAVARKVTDTVSQEFKQINWQAPQIVPIASSHQEHPVYSRVYLPENHMQGEAKRAVVFNHGAGYLQNSHLGWSGYFREYMFHNLLTQQGYVVLDMDYRASAGYGRDWRTAIYRQMGTPETEDLVDGVNWLVKNVNVDRKRIGTYGGSYGGFMTFMALFNEPDLFQAGAALRPVSDWAHYNHGYTSNILNTPDVDPIAYERSSPIYFAQGLSKPLLMNAPMVDNNVFFVDVVRLVQRLIELEKEDFETAIYPVEAHGFVEPSSWLDEYRRIFKLFEENL